MVLVAQEKITLSFFTRPRLSTFSMPKNFCRAFTSAGSTGFQPPREVARHLRAADLAVVGSHREGWSVAMLEALACGLPMVATDVSGARELVRPGENGFVVGAREPGAFAQAMAAALRLPRAREVSLALAADYRLDRLAARLGARWGVLA